jgi:hypothetical protein
LVLIYRLNNSGDCIKINVNSYDLSHSPNLLFVCTYVMFDSQECFMQRDVEVCYSTLREFVAPSTEGWTELINIFNIIMSQD